MPMSPATARRELLRRLLEAHERSRAFGAPAPWRRDVLLRLDAREFPAAFHPDGREVLAALHAAAAELERAGAARVVRHRGFAQDTPRELRLGPAELEAAYRLARADGFEPLGEALEALAAHARGLTGPPVLTAAGAAPPAGTAPPEWMRVFLLRAAEGARRADLGPIGMSRERFKRERRETLDALTAAAAIAGGAAGWERVVSERVLGDSKRLAAIRPRVADLLARADPRWEGLLPEETAGLLEAYGVRRRPGLLRCAGRAILAVGGREYRLEDFVPTAHLPETWGPAWIGGIVASAPAWITTIENEYPFLAYAEEAGGPAGLGARGEVAVYTAGFPAPAIVDALAEVARLSPDTRFRHWGDADLGGLRIWWLLRTRLGRPLAPFRTDAGWLEREAGRGGVALGDAERAALGRLRDQLGASPAAAGPDVVAAIGLVDALLRLGVKVEQERY